MTFDTCLSEYATSLTVLNATDGVVVFPRSERSIGTGYYFLMKDFFPHERGCGVTSVAAKATVYLDPGSYSVVVDGGLYWEYDS